MIENRLKKGLGRGLASLLGETKKIETNKKRKPKRNRKRKRIRKRKLKRKRK